MGNQKIDIFAFAHWIGMKEPKLMGRLSALKAKGKKAFSFEYEANWLVANDQVNIDPDIQWYTGLQYPMGKENFGLFLDSIPDRWGRTLLQRRASLIHKKENPKKQVPKLYDIDFLLGVFDQSRMGALRFKLDLNGPFLDDKKGFSIPPWSSIRELQKSAKIVESGEDHQDIDKWLKVLIAPGSSLGGARPKANLLDHDGSLWIAKFPSKNDINNKAAWEYLAYQLATQAGIIMSASKLEKISGRYHTFFTKRFDRKKEERIHFASAMTMTGNSEESVKDNAPSYLEIAEFIQYNGVKPKEDLAQLWRRIIFNILISNTDDHLRNHGFLLMDDGWHLSPAFDINPSIEKDHLSLNIDMEDSSLDIELAKSVGSYFLLDNKEMKKMIKEVKASVKNWKSIAGKIGLSRAEQSLMEAAFVHGE